VVAVQPRQPTDDHALVGAGPAGKDDLLGCRQLLELLVGVGVVADHLGGELPDLPVMRTGQGKFALLDLEQPGLGCLAHEPAVRPAQLVVLLEGWDRVGDGRADRRRDQPDEHQHDREPHALVAMDLLLSSPWTFSSVSHVPGKGG